MMNAKHRQTPSQTVGPFFHDTLVSEGGNILVEDATRGERIRIFGSVLDGDGVPVPDALLEIWQPDARGLYPHTSDPRAEEADGAFCGFGRAATDDDGLYWFETIKPGGPAPEAGAAGPEEGNETLPEGPPESDTSGGNGEADSDSVGLGVQRGWHHTLCQV